ncbi:lamin tail domain-containing protein [Candidatus Roizmanbacteria bacterium]|nr:lamin tail domain-containing protein [Candidatus Roizmanbacteria bacterium]
MRKAIIISLIFVILSGRAFAQSKILINEFLIDSQPQQAEIFNSGIETVDISGWIVDDSGGTTFYTIPQSSILNPNSCLVFSGDFNLNKTTPDTIKLINSTQQLIDSFTYKASSGSGISYQRLPDGENNWTTGSANLGKFNSYTEQSCSISKITPTISPTPTETEQIDLSPTVEPTPTITAISYNNIFISEIMTHPELNNNEWVELYNNNDYSVTLINWLIDDLENSGSSQRMFSLEIPAKSYKIYSLTSSIFNNSGDTIRLLDFNKTLKDDFEYNSSIQGKTWGRIDLSNDNFCLQEPSYELINNGCLNPSPTLTVVPKMTNIPSPELKSSSDKPAGLSLLEPRNTNLPTNSNIYSNNEGEIMGIMSKKENNNLLVRLLSFISLSYSLLTIGAILIKMKFIYGKGNKFLSSFIYTGGTQQLPS